MVKTKSDVNRLILYSNFEEQSDEKHPVNALANKTEWFKF